MQVELALVEPRDHDVVLGGGSLNNVDLDHRQEQRLEQREELREERQELREQRQDNGGSG